MTRLKCENGVFDRFSIDPMTRLRLQYAKACTKHLTGMEANNSTLIRDALRQYIDRLEELLEMDQSDLQRVGFSYFLKTAAKSDTRPPDKLLDNLNQQPFPKLSDLLKARCEESREQLRKELKSTWFYVQGLKMSKTRRLKKPSKQDNAETQ